MDTEYSVDKKKQILEAYKDLQNGLPKLALDKLLLIQDQWPKNCDVKHLIALCYKSEGDVKRSKKYFLQCLNIQPNQPEVHNNLANLLKSKEQYVEAQKHYQSALSLNPQYLEAQRNLAICYQAQTDYQSAIAAYRKAIEISPVDVSAITGMADCLRFINDFEAAKLAYEHAIEINPTRFNSWHNLGLNFHLEGQLSQAIDCYRKAYEISPNNPEGTQSLALSLYQNGNVGEAITLFKNAIQVHPMNVLLHEHFNNMLWETEFADQFGQSYENAIRQPQASSELSLSYASLLFRAGRVQQAKAIIDDLELNPRDALNILSLRGQIDAELGEFDSAYLSLKSSLDIAHTKNVAQQMVKIDLLHERYEDAQGTLNGMFSAEPNCQLTWALQSLVWRFTKGDRYRWLCDYDNFIKVYQLEVPAPYASLDEFLGELTVILNAMHQAEREPLQQTLRSGTQTASRLLHSRIPALQHLKASLEKIVKQYISELPEDNEHPFLARKSDQFVFSGSWSVKLRADGFHVNHVHPDGWISSSCYISTPKSMESSDAKQGYIKFGESPLELGEGEFIQRSIEPKPGMVVLFPSYFWHGTYPFSGDKSDYRLTAPFDITPY